MAVGSTGSTSSSFYNALGIKNTGIGGLVSGLETESLVEALTAGTRAKIAKHGQNKQLLNWKMTAYRSMAASLRAYQDKYLKFSGVSTGATNLSSSTFFNTVKTTSSSSKVTVKSGSAIGNYQIEKIQQLVTYETVKNKTPLGSKLTGSVDLSTAALPTNSFEGQTLDVTVDGIAKTIQLDSLKNAGSAEDIKSGLQTLINKAFGFKDINNGTPTPLVQVSLDYGRINLDSTSSKITVSASSALGFTANQSNRVSTSTKLSGLTGLHLDNVENYKFSINGVDFDFSKDATLGSFIDKINSSTAGVTVSYSTIDGSLKVTSKTGGAGDNIIMSDTAGNLIDEMFGAKYNGSVRSAYWVEGKYAEIVVNGETLFSATNTFSFNGVTVEVNDVTTAAEEALGPIKLSVSSDPDTLVKQIKDWINDYNALLITLNTAINEEKNSAYPPLTDEQKADMTDDQIKTWEAEAKKGLLRGDTTLRGIVSDLRANLFKKVEAAGISLYDLGIATKSYESGGTNPINAGTIELTEKGEEKLRNMIETSPDKVRLLFTGEDGLTARMNTVVDRATRTSSTNRGSLVLIAGTELNTGDNTSTLGNKIDNIDKYVTALKSRLENEYNRYWKKFTALETALQKMNTQSSWLSSWGS